MNSKGDSVKHRYDFYGRCNFFKISQAEETQKEDEPGSRRDSGRRACTQFS